MNGHNKLDVSAGQVEVECAECGTPVLTSPIFATPARRKNVRCPAHTRPPVDEAPPSHLDLWLRRVPRLAGARIDGIQDPNCQRLVRAFADKWPTNLPPTLAQGGILLSGPTGIGKTWACYALLHALVGNGQVTSSQIVLWSEAETLPELGKMSSFHNGPQHTGTALGAALHGKRVLLLDDLGQGRYPDEGMRHSLLRELLDLVIRNDILLLVTTNMHDQEALTRHVGHAGFSRLWQRVGHTMWQTGTVDQRRSNRG